MSDKKKYWYGVKNKSVRYYWYCQRGLELLNEFRYLVMAVFALYYTLKLTNPLLMVVMFLVAIPVLLVFGWLKVHHMAKIMEFLNIEYSTHWSKYGIELQEKRNELLEEIKQCLHQGTFHSGDSLEDAIAKLEVTCGLDTPLVDDVNCAE